MGMDMSGFSPWAKKQILQKLAEQERKKDAAAQADLERKKNKYGNKSAERTAEGGNGKLHFDSQKEARRYDELMLMLKAGEIRDLRLQQNFTLQEAYTLPNGNRVRAIVYKADFAYEKRITRPYQTDGGYALEWVEEWEKVVEDVKGGSATKTRVYALKRKMLLDKFGIEIREV